MNYATIKNHDIANGLGVRVSLFVSGCTHHCKGCFNPETWDFNYGNEFTEEVQQEVISALAPDYISGLSLLGGEPFEPSNQASLVPFLKKVKELYPEKDIWCYSGYNFESDMLTGKLGDASVTDEMLSYIDILVDGEFVESLKDISLRFKGSSNQRIIDVQQSLKTDTLVLWGEEANIDRKDIAGGSIDCCGCGE
ncbi:MAG: anaerobic ribonucleoside-triphosphate reductase activating protein [Clostridia bacterium]|nr:anaerobic ribonucleoside-triphosphate reductase activating protein [Clostridia bacterium]